MSEVNQDAAYLERALQRERDARRLTEQLLAEKTGELAAANHSLAEARELMDQRVEQSTRELEAQAAAAAETSRAMGDFLANVSQEVRTSMQGLQGLLQITLNESSDPRSREQLAHARDCADALLVLLKDVLDISRLDAGQIAVEHVPFRLDDVQQAVTAIFAQPARVQGITLEVRRAHDVPEWCVGDATRLRQILVHLVGDAVRRTKSGRITVAVESAPDQRRGHENWVRVRYAVRARTAGEGEGEVAAEGARDELGRSIFRRLVTAIGGRSGVENDGAASPWIEVPFAVAGTPVEERGEPPAPGAAAPWRPAPGQRVLLVDDQPINRLIARRLIERMGVAVVEVANGREALELLAAERFSAILMDEQMPEMDGLDTTAAIRDARSVVLQHDIPIVALTASVMNGDRERCLAAGMNDYLSKPVVQEELATTLAHYLVAATPPSRS